MLVTQEIKKMIKDVEDQLAIEKDLLHSMQLYRDCQLKTIVVNQCQGVIRGLELALRHLDNLKMISERNSPTKDPIGQMSFEDQIDYRGGMV